MTASPRGTKVPLVLSERTNQNSHAVKTLITVFQVRVLGPVEVQPEPDGDNNPTPVELASKPQLLISLLAARSGQWIPSELLLSELWRETMITSATKTLHGNVLRVRRALGPSTILSRRGAYCLSAETSLDSMEFEQRCAAIERSMAHDHLDATIRKVFRAESLWRGEPFENVDETPTIARARFSLVAARRRLRELRVDLLIQAGDARSTIIELERCVGEDPYCEDYWALLIRALYLSERQSDALHAFGRARRVLAADLGLEPGPRLKLLEAAILRSDDFSIRTGDIDRVENQSTQLRNDKRTC
jgi:DNA-binding SARP family transcriptional activator